MVKPCRCFRRGRVITLAVPQRRGPGPPLQSSSPCVPMPLGLITPFPATGACVVHAPVLEGEPMIHESDQIMRAPARVGHHFGIGLPYCAVVASVVLAGSTSIISSSFGE